ncbi:NrfJ [Shewanella maritima]|uniref:NrfJ n=1 Tax=Shewanella maritima TaxID=2520507 RepID=UPI0037356227
MKAKFIKLIAAATLALGVTSAWAQGVIHQGEVLETMNGGGYTYVQIKNEKDTFWAAGPQTEVAKGDIVQVSEQMWMSNFKSSSLNKTFEKLMFAGHITKK